MTFAVLSRCNSDFITTDVFCSVCAAVVGFKGEVAVELTPFLVIFEILGVWLRHLREVDAVDVDVDLLSEKAFEDQLGSGEVDFVEAVPIFRIVVVMGPVAVTLGDVEVGRELLMSFTVLVDFSVEVSVAVCAFEEADGEWLTEW